MQDDLEVTGISRSGRVRKKSSKLMDFESPDDIEAKYRRQTPVKAYTGFKPEEQNEFQETPQRSTEEMGTASGSESDFYENNGENADSMESDSSGSDEGSTRTPANSLYMMEKSNKKKLIIKDGRVVGEPKLKERTKPYQRDWEKCGQMSHIMKGTYGRKAKRFAMQKEQSNQATTNKIISNPSIRPPTNAGPGRPAVNRAPRQQAPAVQNNAIVPVNPVSTASPSVSAAVAGAGVYRVTGCGAVDVAAHLRLLGESLAIIGERLKEHEGQIAVSGSVSVLLDTLLCSLAPLLSVSRAIPAIAPPARLLQDTLHNIAYIMPGL